MAQYFHPVLTSELNLMRSGRSQAGNVGYELQRENAPAETPQAEAMYNGCGHSDGSQAGNGSDRARVHGQR